MQQKLFQNFFTIRSRSFSNIEKEPKKPRAKLENYVYYIFRENICSAYNSTQVVVFLQKCNNFVEQQLEFSHFEGSIIP